MEELLFESLVGAVGDWEIMEDVGAMLGREDWFIASLLQWLVH